MYVCMYTTLRSPPDSFPGSLSCDGSARGHAAVKGACILPHASLTVSPRMDWPWRDDSSGSPSASASTGRASGFASASASTGRRRRRWKIEESLASGQMHFGANHDDDRVDEIRRKRRCRMNDDDAPFFLGTPWPSSAHALGQEWQNVVADAGQDSNCQLTIHKSNASPTGFLLNADGLLVCTSFRKAFSRYADVSSLCLYRAYVCMYPPGIDRMYVSSSTNVLCTYVCTC